MEFGFSLPSRSPITSMEYLRTLAQHADLQHPMDRLVQEVKPGVNASNRRTKA
jgi:hypothetical protein